jgi:flavin reductase (DIM6/NTAB) family NADH-FMN oxidoreductase RutF
MGRTAQIVVSMVASLANSLSSKPPLVQAHKRKPIAYKRLEHRNKAVASHTPSKKLLECANLFAPCPGLM